MTSRGPTADLNHVRTVPPGCLSVHAPESRLPSQQAALKLATVKNPALKSQLCNVLLALKFSNISFPLRMILCDMLLGVWSGQFHNLVEGADRAFCFCRSLKKWWLGLDTNSLVRDCQHVWLLLQLHHQVARSDSAICRLLAALCACTSHANAPYNSHCNALSAAVFKPTSVAVRSFAVSDVCCHVCCYLLVLVAFEPTQPAQAQLSAVNLDELRADVTYTSLCSLRLHERHCWRGATLNLFASSAASMVSSECLLQHLHKNA